MRSLKLGLRTLAKAPVITGVAILSLALGIGANAAIFSLFDQMVLRALPVQEPGRLVNFANPGPKPGSTSCGNAGGCDEVFSYAMFRDLEQQARSSFEGIAAHVPFGANLAYANQTISGQGILVSGSYFPLLGVRPALGRLLTPEDDQTIGAHYVTVLSHGYWQNRLGADPTVLNQTIVVNGQAMTIVGVTARGFEGTTLGAQPDLFVPITMRGVMVRGFDGFDNRRSYWAYLFSRLKPGATIEQASAEINTIYRPIINDVEAELQQAMSDQTMARFRDKRIVLADGRRGQSSLHAEVKTPLTLLLTITGVVLLIACANIANLLLARGAGRSQEMAIRGSLGAGRAQLVGQLLLESCLLAVLGGIGGILVARWTLGFIGSILPAEAAQMLALTISPKVLVFAGLLSIATGILFGLYPALHTTRPDLMTVLKASSGQPSGARAAARFRNALVTAQIGLSMTLLVAAGLFIKSLANVSRVDLGLATENVVMFELSPVLNGYQPDRSRTLYQQVEDELAALPGVSSVTAGRVPLIAGNNWGNSVNVQGFQRGPDVDNNSRFNMIGPGYFSTLGIPLVAGREFTLSDGLAAPKVAVVNQTFAKKFGLGGDAVGKFMAVGSGELDIQIVGLVTDAKYSEVKQEIPPLFFTPYRQNEGIGSMTFYARTATDPGQVLRAVPAMIARLDPSLPVEELKTLDQQVQDNIVMDRVIGILSAAFAVLATVLAAIGLYGVLAYTVAQRTREIGLRMALGADSQGVRAMVLWQVGRMTIIGGVLGLAAAIGIGRVASSLLFEMKGHDPAVVAAVVVVLGAVALAAGLVPAHRASQVEPMRALRYE
ncbi:MAG TPA: ABC transporter permease [Vicinamibacteria bacterium]|nr:ABC transporter permease [Vicinamibacteria bacterium]